MIANQTFGDDFGDLGDYLRRGRGRVDPSQRVGWVEFRNLPTRRMDIAERIMAGTASLSYTSKPVFHLSISFAPGDAVDEALMKRVMARTLADLGLGEHQAVIVAHIDTDDPHVHAMVNRVHPETGVAWKGSWSRLRAEASLRRQELDEGLRVVPGWLARVPGHPELRPRPRLARADEEFLREVRQRAEPVLEHAQSWADVEAGLAEFGLSVRVNGRGMSITDGRQQVKASEVGRQFSRGNLEEQFGRYSDYSARVAVASAKSIRDAGGASPARVGIESKAQPERRAAPEAQPRFSLYEDDGIFGVWDSRGPQIFFAETRERAEVEMQRAEWLAARYPNIRAVRCLCDMDGECRDARGLPRLPEEKGRAPRTVHPVAVAESPHADVAAADIAPEPPTHAAQPELHTPLHAELAQPQPAAPVPQQAEESIAPRFTLYEYEGIFGVLDSAGPQLFFVETRERALEEVERANEIVAVYPKTISIGYLREMDGAWRDARGLPRLPEPQGHRISVHWPGSLPAQARVAPVTQAETAPANEIVSPTMVEGGAEPIRVLEPLPRTEPVREEGETQQHGLEPPGHKMPDQSAHEQGRDDNADAPPEVRLDDPAVEAAVHAFMALQDASAAAGLARTLRAERTRAEEVLATLDHQDRELERTREDFKTSAASVYRDPVAAIAAWNVLVRRVGNNLETACQQVEEQPKLLGTLLSDPDASILERAAEKLGHPNVRIVREVPQMLRRAVLYTPALREAVKPAEWETPDGEKIFGRTTVRLRANAVVAERTAQIKAAEARIPEIGGVAGAERNVQLAFHGLSPAQRSQAGQEITAWAAANDITEAAVAANLAEVLGKTHHAARRARELGEGPRGF